MLQPEPAGASSLPVTGESNNGDVWTMQRGSSTRARACTAVRASTHGQRRVCSLEGEAEAWGEVYQIKSCSSGCFGVRSVLSDRGLMVAAAAVMNELLPNEIWRMLGSGGWAGAVHRQPLPTRRSDAILFRTGVCCYARWGPMCALPWLFEYTVINRLALNESFITETSVCWMLTTLTHDTGFLTLL